MGTVWTNSRDGNLRTELRITFRLTADDLANVLAYSCEVAGLDTDAVDAMTTAEITEHVRGTLKTHGMQAAVDLDAEVQHEHAIHRAFGGEEPSDAR